MLGSSIHSKIISTLTRRAKQLNFRRALALLLLLLVIPFFILLALPGSLPYHYIRIAAGYVGFGWCHPFFPPETVHAFSPSPPPWAGDAAFWTNFPCARSAYKVWLPEGTLPLTAPPAEAYCDNVIVSALFDIGRGEWPFFARSAAYYQQQVTTVLQLRNPLVFFTTPEFAETVVAVRRAAGLMDRTMVVAHGLHCASQAWLLPAATYAMCAPEATARMWAFSPTTIVIPERQEPWYNVAMWMKAGLVRAVATLPHPALGGGTVTWLDAGCHGPMCGPELAGTCLAPAPWARPGRIRIAQVGMQTDELAAMSPTQWERVHPVLFAGTIFSMPRAAAAELMDAFIDTVQWLLVRGVAATDQSVFAWLWIRAPQLVDAAPAIGSWSNVVRSWAGLTPVTEDHGWFPTLNSPTGSASTAIKSRGSATANYSARIKS